MSQYSYGKLQVTRSNDEQLPFAGGYDQEGNLTTDPGSIASTMRILPTGLWKGSGLAITLDLVAAILSNGNPTSEMDKIKMGGCGGCSQVFVAVNPYLFGTEQEVEKILTGTIRHLENAEPIEEGVEVFYPGQRTKRTREESEKLGIFVDEVIWKTVCAL